MHLLHSETYQLKHFGSLHPPYAILSHTWEDEEVTFQDMQGSLAGAREKKGFKKIEGCCRQAQKDGFEWVWIDTCCIDKSSSAELSEAINSMYRWYQGSGVCYAYLADVPRLTLSPFLGNHNEFPEGGKGNTDLEVTRIREQNSFQNSRWFGRGWTLQELIAPKNVEFYAYDWSEIGTKLSLTSLIEKRTGIQSEVICGRSPAKYTVATRMSWAAGRDTSREEDVAYCLMGIFDVNMPLLYGEGSRAFKRLQEEVLRKSEACSLFAWNMPSSGAPDFASMSGSVLAKGPGLFRHLSAHEIDDGSDRTEYYSLSKPPSVKEIPIDYSAESFRIRTLRRMFDPPTITSRGILATLFTIPIARNKNVVGLHGDTNQWLGNPAPGRRPTPWWGDALSSSNRTLLAWTFCHAPLHDRLLCILLEIPAYQEQGEGMTTHVLSVRRVFCDITVAIPVEQLHRFKPTKLYLSSAEASGSDIPMEMDWNPSANRQLKGIRLYTSQPGIDVIEAFPRRQIQRDAPGSYYLGFPRWDGMVTSILKLELSAIFISISRPGNRNTYAILFGLSELGGQVYCDLQPIHPGASLASQNVKFQHFVEDLHKKLAVKTDRLVRSFPGYNIRLTAKRTETSVPTSGGAFNLLLSIQVD